MNTVADSKGVYAQSSDIKSRTYLQYRCDMKRKAIAELEIKNWLENKLKELHNTDDVTVLKGGGDAHIWFLRSGKISGEPDYVACINGHTQRFEFQYSSQDDLPFYDFKVSKVGKKVKGIRIPHSDRTFLYIIKPSSQFAIFSPEWVMQNGEESGVPAWGNRTAFRVPKDRFKLIFEFDENLSKVIEIIEKKNYLLETQLYFIQRESRDLSNDLQKIIDHEETFKIIPKTLDGFYKACFLMDKIQKYPVNYSLWLVYGASFYSDKLNSREFSRLVYSLDFLYGGSDELEENALAIFVQAMQKISDYIESMQQRELQTCSDLSPKEEVVNFLFAVSLYEDMSQELRYLYDIDCFPPVNKIFQSIEDMDCIFKKL